jgi:hypothetical protein
VVPANMEAPVSPCDSSLAGRQPDFGYLEQCTGVLAEEEMVDL